MRIERKFVNEGERYFFDFTYCQPKDGWAQVDDNQDARYFGQWANPFTLRFISYVEGDITIMQFDDVKEFQKYMLAFLGCESFRGVDAGLREENKKRWLGLGLGVLLDYTLFRMRRDFYCISRGYRTDYYDDYYPTFCEAVENG